jgi:Ecdysteroid kinase-like family
MTVAVLPARVEEVTEAWLTDALRRSRRLVGDEAAVIAGRKPVSAGTSFATSMYRLRLSGVASVPSTAILKLPVFGPLRAFLDGVGAYTREIAFYSELAGEVPVAVPECYVAEQASSSSDFVLLIEDLTDSTAGDSLTGLSVEQAELAADALARFHAWSWEHERLETLKVFPRLDGEVGRRTCALIAQMFSQTWPGVTASYALDGELRAFGDHLPELMPWFIERLSRPRTIAHGELRADNLFLRADGLTLIDFQTVCQHSGMVDVSYLFSQSLPLEVRRGHEQQLLHRYIDGLTRAGVTDYGLAQATEQYRIGILFNLVWACLMHGQLAGLDARGRALVDAMLTRAFSAIDDNECLALLP